jgi:hypothetical protein
MPTPAFCALDEVYSDWNFKNQAAPPNLLQPTNNQQSHQSQQSRQQHQQPSQPLSKPLAYQPSHQFGGGSNQHAYPQLHPAQNQGRDHFQNEPFQQDEDTAYIPNNNGMRSFCPNCQNCVEANDVLQQRIIEQNIWPRPRWTPQFPNAYTAFDPFNRYWMNNVPQSHIEEFGNVMNGGIFENFGKPNGNVNGINTETLLQIILFILIALFIIQLIECLYMRCTE